MAKTTPDERYAAVERQLRRGVVIPAHPLALDGDGKLDERRQRALSRYYLAAGAGGLAVGVHTTQFQIRHPAIDLLEPVLRLAAEEMNKAESHRLPPLIRVAGICGDTDQAVREATLARDLGYDFGLVNLGTMRQATVSELLAHCRAVADVIGLFGFYLQPQVGGIELPYEFWRGLCEIERLKAVKVAAFDRYRTLTVVRAVAESGREDVALYTGNDDNIIADLVTPYRFAVAGRIVEHRFVGGLLGQWAVGTSRAVAILEQCHAAARQDAIPAQLLQLSVELTDTNAAVFDAPHDFRGCIFGIHEVLRRQGLLEIVRTLDENEQLSPGQAAQLDRVLAAYPHLHDDAFIAAHRDEWLQP